MSVVNGQIANQTTFNNAFMSRTSATTSTVAAVALQNTADPNSGAFVQNIQRAINKVFEGLGSTGESDAAINDYANQNYISNGDNRKVAIGKLDQQLKTTQDDLDQAELDIDSAEARLDDIESNPSSFGGDKTFTDNVIIQGNLTVEGTTTAIDTDNLEVEDQNILVNKNGTDGTAEGAGITVERPAGDAGLQFDSTLSSKWKLGIIGTLYEVLVSGVAQTVSGLKDFVSGIKTDFVNESTLDAGVTVDGVLIKDGLVDGRDVSQDGTDLDQAELDIVALDNRLDDIESNPSSFGGDKTFTDDVDIQGNAVLKNIEVQEEIFLGSVVNTQTGSNQEITTVNAPVIRLTGAGLASFDAITPPTGKNKKIILINQTGASVIAKDNVDNLQTGTGADVQIADNQAVAAIFDDTTSMWYLHSVGGSGSGGGGGQKTFVMKINGQYNDSVFVPSNSVDGFWIAPNNIQITNVFIYAETIGSSGTTELDLKVKPFLSGAFTSIFLTTPKVASTASANSWCGQGDTVTGCTAPVMTSSPFAVAAKSALRLDLVTAMAGNPKDCGLIVVYEEI
jgi:hypothetical protein